MGYLIARVAAFYALGHSAVMALPMRIFWLYSAQIDRIQAANDQRALRVALCVQNPESAAGLIEELTERMGVVTKSKEKGPEMKSNREGIAALRALQATLGG